MSRRASRGVAGRAARGALLVSAAGVAMAVMAAAAAIEPDPLAGAPRAVLEHACLVEPGDAQALAARLGAALVDSAPELRGEQRIGWRARLGVATGDVVEVIWLARSGVPTGVGLEISRAVNGGRPRPVLHVSAGARCVPRSVRRLVYDADGRAAFLEDLDPGTLAIRAREPVNPPVPGGADPGGVRVGMVDSGIDYRLPEIASRLARDGEGRALGYDFWDLDDRPFDADSPTPFRVRRHGTRTASIVLAEAPVASVVAYRFPRPEMSRMADLVARAAADGVRILNLSLGSSDFERWRAFDRAARAHPDLLMVVSAGNDERDIDQYPVYPASLGLENVLSVTSSEDNGSFAFGSNFGVRAVDVAVPAERRVATGFGGAPRLVSGSSYAAARISALAACLLAGDPQAGAPALRAAIIALARPTPGGPYTAHGFVPEPTASARGACAAERAAPEITQDATAAVEPIASPATASVRPAAQDMPALALRLSAVVAEASGWPQARVDRALGEAAAILAQCGVHLVERRARRAHLPRELRFYDRARARRLVDAFDPARPAVFFLQGSVERPAYDAVAIGRGNAGPDWDLQGTAWLSAAVEPAGLALAHELAHLLADSGEHPGDPHNLMHADASAGGTVLTPAQCERLRARGAASGMLVAWR